MSRVPLNPYRVLQVDPGAEQDVIDVIYRKLAAKHHPDRDSGSSDRMLEINQAYSILKDPRSRKSFDERPVPASPTPWQKLVWVPIVLALIHYVPNLFLSGVFWFLSISVALLCLIWSLKFLMRHSPKTMLIILICCRFVVKMFKWLLLTCLVAGVVYLWWVS